MREKKPEKEEEKEDFTFLSFSRWVASFSYHALTFPDSYQFNHSNRNNDHQHCVTYPDSYCRAGGENGYTPYLQHPGTDE